MNAMQLAVSNFLNVMQPRPGITMNCTECGTQLGPPHPNCRKPEGNRFCNDECCKIYHNKKRRLKK